MAIFAGMEIQHDDGEYQSVNVRYANADRVTEAILAGNTQNALIVLPVISIFLNDIELAPDRKKGTGTVRTTMVAPPGSLPNEVETLYQKQPIPYNFIFDVTIWSYNSQQDFQIAEQILTLFDPTMQIQTSDSRYDPTSITTIELMNVQDETEAAIGTERRMLKRTYTFTVYGWLSSPALRTKNLLERIKVNLYNATQNIENIDIDLFNNSDFLETITVGEAPTCNSDPQ